MSKHAETNYGMKWAIIFTVVLLLMAGYFSYNFLQNKEDKSQNVLTPINNTKNVVTNTIENKLRNNTLVNEIEEKKEETDLFSKYYKKAEELMENMTLEEQVSQMFIARCPEENAVELVKNEQPGGYILFGRDFKNKTKKQVTSDIQSYQKVSKIPMIIGTDEEGGTVVRVSSNRNLSSKTYSSPQVIYKSGGLTEIQKDAKEKSKVLLDLGINLNFAPVCDVSTSSKDFIYQRSFGKNATETGKYVETVVKAMNEQKIGSALKHFPGYGNNIDTHTDVSRDKRNMKTFETSDFIPFQKGIDAGAPIVLVSHNIVECIDKENPASLSKEVHKILKEDLKFTGLTATDDLAMSAITKYASISDAAVMAVQAGNDLILTSDFKTQKEAVIKAVESGKISTNDMHVSVKKVLAYKYQMGLL